MLVAGRQPNSPFKVPPRGEGPGVLEIKCPYNKGRPEAARPYTAAPWYYMAQV